MFSIPDAFALQMIQFHAEEGRAWLEHLPTILSACEERWQIHLAPPFPNLSFHYVAPAIRADGTPVVLKACSPTGEFEQEREALRLFDGRGMARLLDFDTPSETLLLEGLQPGTLLKSLEDDEEATIQAARVMLRLWRPVPTEHPFDTVQKWGLGFPKLRLFYQGGSGPFPPALLAEAETLYTEHSASMGPLVVLHGDLHHENILAAEREPWLAIDPKGLIGEPAYETGSLLRNPLPDLLRRPQPARILARRIALLSEVLSLDRQLIRDWAVAQAVLSACWNIEADQDPSTMIACAELLASLKNA